MKSKIITFITWLSRSRFLRFLFSFFSDWHSGFVLGDKEKKAIIANQVIGWYRTLFFWKFAPRKYIGGAILNLFGLQFFRYYFYNLRYSLRSKRGAISDDCMKYGISIRQGLISPDVIAKMLEFLENNQTNEINHFKDFSELVITNTNGIVSDDPSYKDITDYLLNNCKILKIGEDLLGLEIKIHPFISVLRYRSYTDLSMQLDGQDTPHADVFYPSFKLFVYLNEVNEDNGAFQYLTGSQRFCFSNAISTYRDSIKYYFQGGKRQLYPVDATSSIKNHSYLWKSANGKAGDAIFFNVQGIHRRGNFKKDQYRERIVLLIDFRQVEVPFQIFAANV